MRLEKNRSMLYLGMALSLAGCGSITRLTSISGVADAIVTQAVAPKNQSSENTANVDNSKLGSLTRVAGAVGKTFEDITPEQEYYIGRAVAATVLQTYKPCNSPVFNRYLNELGQTLSQASDLPETFAGYHFLAVDSDEINAFAAPGGLILVTRGLIRCCATEDALAAVLAHEIGHVEKKHGLKAIKKGRLTSALTVLASEGAKNLGNDELAKLTEDFQGTIGDITSTMMNSGYARTLETEADNEAVVIMKRVGYDPNAFIAMLERMKNTGEPKSGSMLKGFAKTHPDPQSRINAVKARIGAIPAVAEPALRKARFAKATAGL